MYKALRPTNVMYKALRPTNVTYKALRPTNVMYKALRPTNVMYKTLRPTTFGKPYVGSSSVLLLRFSLFANYSVENSVFFLQKI